MKKKMNKSILLSALSALAIGGIGAGATFALFTDRATTTVEIAAGKLDINSAIQNFKVYSVKADNDNGAVLDENDNKYILEQQSVVKDGKHLFKNEGWATYSNDNNAINLVHMSPGDKVTFTLAIDNGQTNINYLYRLHFRSTGSDSLVKGLVTTIGSEKLAGLKQYDSAWMLKAPNDSLSSIDFAIEMPVEKDNRYQMLEASFIIGIEAVQGNAVMTDAAAKVQIEEDVIAKGKVVNNESIILNANAGNTGIATTASIPAGEIAEGEVTYTVSNIVVNDAEGTNESTIGFDIGFKVDNVSHNTFNNPVTVTFNIGAGKVLQGVYHAGVLMDEDDYSYDANSGILTISSNSFSPFTVKYQNEAEQLPEQSSEESIEQSSEVTSEQTSDEQSEEPIEQSSELTSEVISEEPIEQSSEVTSEQSSEEQSEEPIEQSSELTSEVISEEPTEQSSVVESSEEISSEEVTSEIISEEESEQTSQAAVSYVDVLNREFTGVAAASSYVNWSEIVSENGIEYAGQSAGDHDSIQLRATNPSGIVVTGNANGLKAVKITLSWESNTTNGRVVDVYGKESAYSTGADLYSSNSQGTKIGSITYGTSTELEIDGDYAYIGLRSNKGALYLTSITITWAPAA